jgi:hypothetical protein
MKKFLGLILGFIFSLGGVFVWLFLEYVTGYVIGITAYLMGFLFFVGYKLVVPEIKKDAFVFAALVVFFDIILLSAFDVVLVAAVNEISVSELLSDPEYIAFSLAYMLIPLAFGAFGIAGYNSKLKKDRAMQARKDEMGSERQQLRLERERAIEAQKNGQNAPKNGGR